MKKSKFTEPQIIFAIAYYYVRIPRKKRNHWKFPEEWKDKWLESIAWDTLPRR